MRGWWCPSALRGGWRVAEELCYRQIADRLNADLLTNPPPTPVDAGRAAGRWTASNVREILMNPKYTGHMVWNRRARKGTGGNRLNPAEEWVWSAAPAHEALVDLETFVRAQQVAERRQRSRGASGMNRHPSTRRVYRLRGYVFCVLCGRRICGKPSGRITYYVCALKAEYRPAGHPPSIWVREDVLLGGLTRFVCAQVFAGARRRSLAPHMAVVEAEQGRERQQWLASLRSVLADTAAWSRRLLHNLELIAPPDPGLVREIGERHAELQAQQESLQEQLAAALEDNQGPHGAGKPELFSRLPVSPVHLSRLPDDLSRPLFDALRLTIRYDGRTSEAVCRIVVASDAAVGEAIDRVTESERHVVRCEAALADRRDREALQTQQVQAMMKVLTWLVGQPGETAVGAHVTASRSSRTLTAPVTGSCTATP